jgi:hypothetical protein
VAGKRDGRLNLGTGETIAGLPSASIKSLGRSGTKARSATQHLGCGPFAAGQNMMVGVCLNISNIASQYFGNPEYGGGRFAENPEILGCFSIKIVADAICPSGLRKFQ